MAELFLKQAKQYAEGRPSYPAELFQFIASKTPSHDLAWDVGTGSGQAARSLAGFYNNVVATDTSEKQLEFAPKLPNVRYQRTPPVMSAAEVEQYVAAEGSVDVVTVAQAIHWFDLPAFYRHVRWVLKKPDGVIAAWCYTHPRISEPVDNVLDRRYVAAVGKYWDPARKWVDDEYRHMDFPFEPVEGLDHTGPTRFVVEKRMNLDALLTYFRSWSAYQKAKDEGEEVLTDEVINEFKHAWGEDAKAELIAKFPIHLRIGRVGSSNA